MINNLNTLMEESYQTNLKRKTLELELLQYQVNPHYIYNILSAVKSVSDTLRSKTISDIIDSTVKFLRISFNQGNEIISIARELEIIREYISIQLFAFDDTFNVEYSIDPEVNNWYTIKLILQPIVENAIIHGLVKKRDYSGKIKISGKIENDDILFEVEDNGAGMDEDTLIKLSQGDSLKKTSKGYGIRNVQERIQLIFGASYGLSIQSKKNSGTKVTIKIPRYDFKAIENILKKFK
jgi:two-component system sensor histidine kinase YesM